jgi:hypothetical protein
MKPVIKILASRKSYSPIFGVLNQISGVYDAMKPANVSTDYHSMYGIAMQYYGRLRFPMGTCDFWTPPHRNPLTDRYEILYPGSAFWGLDICKEIFRGHICLRKKNEKLF